MREKIYVISDIEMGQGDILDDFTDDKKLVEFVEHLLESSAGVQATLVLNGDTFDFMKMSYKGDFPFHITEEISLWKLDQAFKNHPKVFAALKKFIQKPENKIYFVIGNHDADLVWPKVQEKIKERLGNGSRISFDYYYKRHGLHVEHGHLYDPFFFLKIRKPFTRYKGKKILNTPFGVQIFSSHLIKFKKEFPREERCYPKHHIFDFKPELKKHKNKLFRDIIIKDVIISPIIHFKDPTRRVPYFRLLGYVFRRGMKIMDMSMFLPSTISRMFKKHPGSKIYILGHVHLMAEHNYKNGKKAIFTDTWREEYDLNRNFEKKKKSFAEIKYHDGHIDSAVVKVF
jgi:hypothetical protein